jgi:polysaccharide pyruvyl transferase WcaK-like protein
MKVRLFNVKFSPNLGDGLLSQCLEKALVDLGADPDTWSIDLAARKAYGDVLARRTQIMAALDLLPRPVRREVIRAPLALHAARSWRPHYAHGLADADCVVIGGGNLISDIDLNFPTKLTLAMEEAEKRNLPVVVYASGVTSGWTPRGTEMLRCAFAKPILKGVFVTRIPRSCGTRRSPKPAAIAPRWFAIPACWPPNGALSRPGPRVSGPSSG